MRDFLYNSDSYTVKKLNNNKGNKIVAARKLAQVLITMYRSMAIYESDLHGLCS